MLPRDWSRWCEYTRNKTEFYIHGIFQWDAVDPTNLDRWLANFPDDEGHYLAMQLLNRFIYYSERDVVRLLEHGLYKVLLYDPAIRWARDSAFELPAAEQRNRATSLLSTITFAPLLDRNKPSESGNVLCRYLNQHLDVPSGQICQPWELVGLRKTGIVILDDFIGSGQQIIDFWNKPKLNGNRLSQLAAQHDLDVTYLCLVATRFGLNAVAAATQGLSVKACEILEEDHRVFHNPSVYFGQGDEVRRARTYLSRLCSRRGIPLLGFRDLDYALAFHHSVPDATLPLFYSNTTTWKLLIKRRRA